MPTGLLHGLSPACRRSDTALHRTARSLVSRSKTAVSIASSHAAIPRCRDAAKTAWSRNDHVAEIGPFGEVVEIPRAVGRRYLRYAVNEERSYAPCLGAGRYGGFRPGLCIELGISCWAGVRSARIRAWSMRSVSVVRVGSVSDRSPKTSTCVHEGPDQYLTNTLW